MAVSSRFWRGRRVFITGHTGFKGAWLSLWLQQLGSSVTGYALSPPTNPSLFVLAGVAGAVRSIAGDVRDSEGLRAAIHEAAPEIVFHLAAQSLVRRSYGDPVGTFATNVAGTVNLLETCRSVPTLRAIIVVTSDKCYVEDARRLPYKETDPLGGHDPYSASKACAEIVTAAYRQSFFGVGSPVAVASPRSGNVVGGGDWGEDRLMTDLIGAYRAGRRPRLRNPGATRPWQHVLDPLAGYLMLAERLATEGDRYAEAWNFGPGHASFCTVQTVTDHVADLWQAGGEWEVDSMPQPREATRLELDATKAQERLGWRPHLDLEAALAWTVSWYKGWDEGGNARQLADEQIGRFMAAQGR